MRKPQSKSNDDYMLQQILRFSTLVFIALLTACGNQTPGQDACADRTAPGCLPAHCTNGTRDGSETDTDCGGECGACSGISCQSDAECGPALICGKNNGACFGRARKDSVCWKPTCRPGA